MAEDPYYILWEAGGIEPFASEEEANDALKACCARGCWGFISSDIDDLITTAFARIGVMVITNDSLSTPDCEVFQLQVMEEDPRRTEEVAKLGNEDAIVSIKVYDREDEPEEPPRLTWEVYSFKHELTLSGNVDFLKPTDVIREANSFISTHGK